MAESYQGPAAVECGFCEGLLLQMCHKVLCGSPQAQVGWLGLSCWCQQSDKGPQGKSVQSRGRGEEDVD